MNISLTPQLEKLIQAKVETGMYNNASEVVRAALRLLQEEDELKALKREILRQELQTGIASLENQAGEFTSISEIASHVLKNKSK